MKWYKHISDSLDDPFIFDLINRFGADGYLVFFGTLEIYAREFSPEDNWKLIVTRAYLKQKLCKRQDTLIIKCLEHIKNSGKWNIEINSTDLIIFIPKFTQLLDEWTTRKLGSKSGVTPKILSTDKDTDKDTDKEEDILPPPDADKSAPCPHKEIIKLYHEILPELPVVKVWTPKREGYLRSRWKERKERQALEWWGEYFRMIKRSPFLTGNVKDWKADLEWVLNQSNMVKILEGKYEGGGNGGIRTSRSDPRDKSLQSREDAEVAAITAEYEAAKKAARDKARGTAGNDDAPSFEGL